MVKIKRKVEMTQEEYAKYLIDKYGVSGFESELFDNNIIDAPMEFKQTFELNPVSKSDIPNGTFRNGKLTVEVEEEITEDTEFKTLIEVTEIQNVFTHINTSINEINHDTVVEIHALINGRLNLIWTCEKGLVE